MPHRRLTNAEFARQLLRDATSTSTRGNPARRHFAQRVLSRVFDRAIAEDPERVRRDKQGVILAVYRDALAGNAEAAALYRKSAAAFRADGFDVPDLPPMEDDA